LFGTVDKNVFTILPNSRPVGIAFNQNEDALYIASIGKVEVRTTLPNNNDIQLPEPVPWYYPNTGAIWKITKIPR
jgi:hypothetical protein